jgi:hypothetical protein
VGSRPARVRGSLLKQKPGNYSVLEEMLRARASQRNPVSLYRGWRVGKKEKTSV